MPGKVPRSPNERTLMSTIQIVTKYKKSEQRILGKHKVKRYGHKGLTTAASRPALP